LADLSVPKLPQKRWETDESGYRLIEFFELANLAGCRKRIPVVMSKTERWRFWLEGLSMQIPPVASREATGGGSVLE
jgi:hypothetical protein